MSGSDHHLYEVFGLRTASEIPLPELFAPPTESGGSAPDVLIRHGSIPRLEGERPGLNVRPAGALLNIPDIGRYWMERGSVMVVEPHPEASWRNVRLYLLGSAFAALLHQRALLPLHANAVEIDGKAVAFMGHPGAGKSTLAAWFHDRGFRLLSDDVCVVTFDSNGRPLAHPGIPRLRLWREALEASGRVAQGYELSFDDMDKFNVPTRGDRGGGSVPLDKIYLLERTERSAIVPLSGSQAVEALVTNTYRGGYLPLMKETGRHLFQCVQLSRHVGTFRACRAWGFDRFDSEAAALEAHARSGPARSAGH